MKVMDRYTKKRVARYFNNLPPRVFMKKDLASVYYEQRLFWRLPEMSVLTFIETLIKETDLNKLVFKFPSRRETRYTWGRVPFLVVAASLKPAGFFSHYTALQLHDLTDQVSTTVFLNEEQTPKYVDSDILLSDERIRTAFKRPVRESKNIATLGEYRVCLLSGKNTGRAGVTEIHLPEGQTLPVSGLERTLIDATVRPVYSGGPHSVLQAFFRAKERVSVNRLMSLLHRMEFIYPYHQAIGFYLEHAGYTPEQINLVKKLEIKNDFYLAHAMSAPDYDSHWRLFFPKGLK